MATTAGAALATTHRMRHRILCRAAVVRPATEVPPATGLAPADVLPVGVADLADRRAAADVHLAHLARGHDDHGIVAVAGQQLAGVAGRAGDLAAAPRLQFDVVDLQAQRDVLERHAVADVGLDTTFMPTSRPLGARM